MTDVQQEAPASPNNAAEAVTRLTQLSADGEWANAVLSGNGPQVAQFKSLQEMIATGDNVDKAVSGVLEDGPFQQSGHIQNVGVAASLRDQGIRDEVIREVLSGRPVTQQEHEMAVRWKADHMGDSEYVKKYLAGEREQVREMTLVNIILSSPIKET
jgi:hypothetical protein